MARQERDQNLLNNKQQQPQTQNADQQKKEDQKTDGRQQAQQNAPQPAGEGERKEGEMTQQEAAALLDSQRAQEVQPDEVAKRLQGAVVAEPEQDW